MSAKGGPSAGTAILAKKKKKAKVGVSGSGGPSAVAQGKKGPKKTKGAGSSKKSSGGDVGGKASGNNGDDHKGGGVDDTADDYAGAVNSDSEEDYSDDGEEGEDGYKQGGYHPVSLGDKFNNGRYTVVEKLGWGHFSTVWMVHDRKLDRKTPEFVAVKIQKSASHYRDAAFDEIELLNCVSKATMSERALREYGPEFDPCVVTLLDHFEHSGPHGKHVCMVFEMLGENLLKVIQKYDYRGIPIPIVRDFARQICVGLDFLHRHCRIIHTDLKPENILVARAPPPPPPERLQELLALRDVAKAAAAAAGGSSSSSKKDRGKESGAIEALTKQLASETEEKGLSTEQRKKLKKKLKKKRQKEKKKEVKRRGNRRGGGKGRGGASLEKEEKDPQKREMLMMERDSVPSGKAEAKATMPPVKPGARELLAEQEISNRLAALSLLETDLDPESKHELPDPTRLPAPSSSSASTQQIADYGDDEYSSLPLPGWTRPTLFSFLNFRRDEAPDARGPAGERAALYTTCSSVEEQDWMKPPDVMHAEISMLTSASRLMEVFGPPAPGAEEDAAAAFSGWVLGLRKARYCSPLEERHDAADASLMFSIKGHGFDCDGVFSLVASCMLNAVAFQPDSYSVVIPQNDLDRPVSWTITHHASMTEHLIVFLEQRLEGLRFLAHYKIPSCLCEEDDAELLFAMQRDCRHPASRSVHAPTRNGLFPAESKDEPHRPFAEGQGGILGVDLDSLMASIVGETEMDETYLTSIYDIDRYVRPLEERLLTFVGDCAHLDGAVAEFAAMGQALSRYAGELSNEGSLDGDNDHDSVAEGRGKARPARYDHFDDEFRGSRLKIVDLGNACWTDKHFTDDIQTRQYRCPEVLLGGKYDTSADMWSVACIIFELITGELLFDPRAGKTWDREEDHLAMMIELLGNFPPKVITGKNKDDYFTKAGNLKHIQHLKFWGLRDVLHDKYKLDERDAEEIAAFLGPMLELDPDKRASALECLRHPWLEDRRARPKSGARLDEHFED